MFRLMWQKILILFGKTTQTTSQEYGNNDKYAMDYEKTSNTNITAMFSNKLASLVADESEITIEHDNKRAELLDGILQKVLDKKKKITARIFGTGGIVLIPYVKNGKLYYNKISQNRLSINKTEGDVITDATVLMDTYVVGNVFQNKIYYRWSDYKIVNNTLLIQQRYTTDNGDIVPKPDKWMDVNDFISISNVEQVTIAYIKSPVDNRFTSDLYGVPITYGCERTINKILKTLDDIEREFEVKKAFVGADAKLFKGENKLPENGLYRKLDAEKKDGSSFWEIFDPAIRDSSYFNKLEKLFALLEKEIGTSRGVLTDPLTTYQNTDEVRRALRDTLSIISDMRELFTKGLNDFLYACDVLANYYNLSPMGDYELKTTWGYGLVESYAETMQQYNTGLDKGYVKKAEVRNQLMDETMEESEKVIEEIEKNNPDVKTLLGTNE